MEIRSLIGIAAAEGPIHPSVLKVKTNDLVLKRDGVNAILETKDIRYNTPVVYSIFPAYGSCRSLEGIHMSDFAVSSDNHKLIGDERVSVKLALFPVLSDVIFPLQLPGFPFECADHAVAGTYYKQIAHDRGSGEHSATSIELPKNRWFVGLCRCIRFLGRDQPRKEQKDIQAQIPNSHSDLQPGKHLFLFSLHSWLTILSRHKYGQAWVSAVIVHKFAQSFFRKLRSVT